MRAVAVASLSIALAGVACGDNVHVELPFTAQSGTRLKVVSYVYDDGTRQVDGTQLDDAVLHTRCQPGHWDDETDVERCIPVAPDIVYADPACNQPVGRRRGGPRPAYYIARDYSGAAPRLKRLYRAGPLILMPPTQVYERWGDLCFGPSLPVEGDIFYEVRGEIPGRDLAVVTTVLVGTGRIALRVRTSDDGLAVPLGFRDQTLDLDCTPADRPDAEVACEPADAVATTFFLDPDCAEPAIVVEGDEEPVPAIARVSHGDDCATFHAVGDEVGTPLFGRQADACVPVIGFDPHRFALGPPLELAMLERTVEERPGFRLAPVLLRGDDLHVAADPLYDTATRATCHRRDVGVVSLCLPSNTAAATWRYVAGCSVSVAVVDVPRRGCGPVAFATTDGEDGLEIHAVGDTFPDPLYDHDALGICGPYTSPPGVDVHELGPPIPLDAFPAAVAFGER